MILTELLSERSRLTDLSSAHAQGLRAERSGRDMSVNRRTFGTRRGTRRRDCRDRSARRRHKHLRAHELAERNFLGIIRSCRRPSSRSLAGREAFRMGRWVSRRDGKQPQGSAPSLSLLFQRSRSNLGMSNERSVAGNRLESVRPGGPTAATHWREGGSTGSARRASTSKTGPRPGAPKAAKVVNDEAA